MNRVLFNVFLTVLLLLYCGNKTHRKRFIDLLTLSPLICIV